MHNKCVESVDSDISSEYYQDANGRWHRPNGQFASNEEVGITSPDKVPTGSHGNSLSDRNSSVGGQNYIVKIEKIKNLLVRFIYQKIFY